MKDEDDGREGAVTELIRSPALYLGELRIEEAQSGPGGRLLSGRTLKNRLVPLIYWFARRAPRPLALAPVYLVLGLIRLLYRLPANPLRSSCVYISRLCAQAGHPRDPASIYSAFLDNAQAISRNYLDLYRDGWEAVLGRIDLQPRDRALIAALLERHGGVLIAVPHNLGSAFSGLRLNHAFPTLLIARNSNTIARTRAALDFFERMRVKVLMVRGGSSFELSRVCFSALRSGKVIAATLDVVDRSPRKVTARIFGRRVGFSPWAARIAARVGVPLIPIYVASRGEGVRVLLGEPILSSSVEVMVQHYVSFFEHNILCDPASWAFLADKKWHRVLQDACREPRSLRPSRS
jgi:hypothetical protein